MARYSLLVDVLTDRVPPVRAPLVHPLEVEGVAEQHAVVGGVRRWEEVAEEQC